MTTEDLRSIPVTLVEPSPYQPRRYFAEEALTELAASIRQHGIIQPIVVRPRGPRFELIAGERRWRAAQRAGLTEVPALVRRYNDEQALEAALIENLQREDISVVEAARAYQRLADEFYYSQSEIAQRTGKGRVSVANTLRLLHLPDRVLELLDRGELTEGHARALLPLPYPSLQVELGEWAAANALTVRETERKVRSLLDKSPAAGKSQPAPSPERTHLAALEEQLRERYGTKVGVSYSRGKGALTLEFYSDDDLCRLLELLGIEGR
jgi:ParB family transcriptional regulator, chromosome partitioning protein